MKTLKNTGITLMLALVTSMAAQAQATTLKLAEDEPIATAQPSTFGTSLYRVQQSMTMRLSLEKNLGEKVSIRLIDQDGKELHRESVGRNIQKYACNFDLSKIADGNYTIEIANSDEVQRKSINLSSAEVVKAPARTLVAVN